MHTLLLSLHIHTYIIYIYTTVLNYIYLFCIHFRDMEMKEIAKKVGLSENKYVARKADELRRLSFVKFDCPALGIGEICKAIICLEIAATRYEVVYDRQSLIKMSGMSEKAYIRSFNALQNALGVKNDLDIRELAIKFGCVRIIPFVNKGLALYKDRFRKALANNCRFADFTRPVYTAVAFYLCAKKHKLKVDKLKLIDLCGTCENEFSNVSNSMKDLCHDVFGISKEKKDPKEVKGNRDLLDVLPENRRSEDGGYSSDEEKELSCYKKRKHAELHSYKEWKFTVLESNKEQQAPAKRTKQLRLNFEKEASKSEKVEAQ